MREGPDAPDAEEEEGLEGPVQEGLGAGQQEEVAHGDVSAAPEEEAWEEAVVEGEVGAEDCGVGG